MITFAFDSNNVTRHSVSTEEIDAQITFFTVSFIILFSEMEAKL